jgi:signal transduction histidine kinase
MAGRSAAAEVRMTDRLNGQTALEQAALRRVAALVARGLGSEAVFAAVAEELAAIFDADIVAIVRHEPGGELTMMSGYGLVHFRPGTRLRPDSRRAGHAPGWHPGRAVRIDADDPASPDLPQGMRAEQVRSSVNVPILVEGRTWGVIGVGSRRGPLPADTGQRLISFTELVATAIAGAQARLELRRFAEEQAALRRVAVMVARAAPPDEVFAAVTAEAGQVLAADVTILNRSGRLLDADITGMGRYDLDGAVTIVSTWASTSAAVPVPVGTRFAPGGHNAGTLVFQTGQPVRIDDFGEVTGPVAEPARDLLGARSAVTVPVTVAGRLWGTVSMASTHASLPADTEARLARFTELAATAIANAEARAALTASRARIVAATDAARQRIEQDLHDSAQLRLVSLARQLEITRAAAPPEASELVQQLETAITEANDVLEQLREIAQGLHPSVLADGGLTLALTALAGRSAIPIQLDVRVAGRLPEPTELTAYYAVSEALTNTAKHAHASAAEVAVEVAADQGTLRVFVRDDGRGGADSSRGSGLTGLKDRVEAAGGRLSLRSPPGAGTAVEIVLPLQRTGPPAS